jgi:hypothetical protein
VADDVVQNWVVVVVSGVALLAVAIVPETYAPAILRKRAAKKRKEEDNEKWWSRYDDKEKFWPLLKVNLSRPFVLTVTEPIWWVVLYLEIASPLLTLDIVCSGTSTSPWCMASFT